jgi:tetratricopeptide (TPR) repeat protein
VSGVGGLGRKNGTGSGNPVFTKPRLGCAQQKEHGMATVESTLAQARAHQKKGRMDRARSLCRDVLYRYPGNARARALLSNLPEPAPSQQLLDRLVEAHKAGHTALVAEQAARLLPIYPESYVLWQIHGAVLLGLGAYALAEESLRRAVELRPDLPEARVNHTVALRATGQLAEAERQARLAVSLAPGHCGALMELASVLTDLGCLPEAETLCRGLLERQPDVAVAHNILGVAALEKGRLEEAEACYARAVDLAPGFAEAHRNLSDLKTWTQDDAHLAQMQALYDDPAVVPPDRARLCFALFTAWDRLGHPDRAWPFLAQGNALRKTLIGYDFSQDLALFGHLTALDVQPLAGVAPAGVTPIFIVGMPRSGTTLTEQIISAHPEVSGAGGTTLIADLARDFLTGIPATEERLRQFRKACLAGLARGADGARFVTDKMPQNFCFLPLICAALPEARIVHVERDAAAVCWSNLRQCFATQAHGYCYDPEDLVAYHALYLNWMSRCDSDWPGRLRRLDYEALMADQEGETRALIADLGLEWHEACLSPQATRRSVDRASAAQVSKAVYAARSDAWRPYAPWLGEIFARLPADS